MVAPGKPTCGQCKYFGFRGLQWICRHPAIKGRLSNLNPCECYVADDEKVVNGQQGWVEPVKEAQ